MSEKGLKSLLILVVVLLGVWLVISFLPRGGGIRGAQGDLGIFFQGVTAEGVSEVRFQEPGVDGSVRLRRTGGDWQVNGYRADSGAVARFWETVAEARIGDLVGANPTNHGRMGVTGDSAWTFEVELSGEMRTLMVGKSGSRYGTAYVRLPDENEVYLLEGNLRPTVTRNLDDWRNKRVVDLDTAQVQRIEFEREGTPFVLERSDTLWALEGGGLAEKTPVRNLLSELARLEATGFYSETDTLSESGGWVRVLGMAGDTMASLELGSGEGDRWIRAAGDSVTYRLTSWRVGRLLPALEELEGEG